MTSLEPNFLMNVVELLVSGASSKMELNSTGRPSGVASSRLLKR